MPVKHKGLGMLAAAQHTCLAFYSMLNKKDKRQQCIFPREQGSLQRASLVRHRKRTGPRLLPARFE